MTDKSLGATANGILIVQTNMSPFSGFATTGDSDSSPDGTASQFLLLRGLEPGVNEELLAKGVSKLCKTKASTPPVDGLATKKAKISSTTGDASLGAREGSLRRVLLVRDRKSGDSWRYGFAEFNSVVSTFSLLLMSRQLCSTTYRPYSCANSRKGRCTNCHGQV